MAILPCLLAFLYLHISSLAIPHSSILDKKVATFKKLKPSVLAFDPIPSWYSRSLAFACNPPLSCILSLPASFCLVYMSLKRKKQKQKNFCLNFMLLILSCNPFLELVIYSPILLRSLKSGYYYKYTPDNVLSSITRTSNFFLILLLHQKQSLSDDR